MPMDTANKQRGLPVLILLIRFDAASDQESHHVLPSIPAGQVKRRRERRVHKLWLRARLINQKHEHFCIALARCLVDHRLTEGVVESRLENFVPIEILLCGFAVVELDGLPELFMLSGHVALGEAHEVFVGDVHVRAALLGLERAVEFLFLLDGRILHDLVLV